MEETYPSAQYKRNAALRQFPQQVLRWLQQNRRGCKAAGGRGYRKARHVDLSGRQVLPGALPAITAASLTGASNGLPKGITLLAGRRGFNRHSVRPLLRYRPARKSRRALCSKLYRRCGRDTLCRHGQPGSGDKGLALPVALPGPADMVKGLIQSVDLAAS
jgi:hypothetical protein